MRAFVTKSDLKKIFEKAKQQGVYKQLPIILKASPRTIYDWQRSKYSMPADSFEKLISITKFDKKYIQVRFVDDYFHASSAGKKGGQKSAKLYGNPGTTAGRSKGGLASIVFHKKNKTNFSTLKTISKPNYSSKLAELLGIMFGDGHLSQYQASVFIGIKSDIEYCPHIAALFEKLFDIKPTIKNREYAGTIDIYVSSKEAVKFLAKKGMPVGNKINNNLNIPMWIIKSEYFKKAFVRGLFDTDGCIYCDRHRVNGKLYEHLGWTITSYADSLIIDIIKILTSLGFSPTHTKKQHSIFLRKQSQIAEYFEKIGTNNPKHKKRFEAYLGRVPKWS